MTTIFEAFQEAGFSDAAARLVEVAVAPDFEDVTQYVNQWGFMSEQEYLTKVGSTKQADVDDYIYWDGGLVIVWL